MKVPAGIVSRISAPHGRCAATVERGHRRRRCNEALTVMREGEGRTLKMWLECPLHERAWIGASR